MPKQLTVKMSVPSRSRPDSMLSWLNKLLEPHNMTVIEVTESAEDPTLQRFGDGRLKPFLSAMDYDDLRDDDKFLYNRRPE